MDEFDFVILGLAHCFQRDDDGHLSPILMIEPIPSAAFLTLLQDIPSSFSQMIAVEPRSLFDAQGQFLRPQGFPTDARIPHDFYERLMAAARTFQYNPQAKSLLKIGQIKTLTIPQKHKRIINPTNSVSDDDNIKQHPITFEKI